MAAVQVPAICNENRETTQFIIRHFPSDKLGLSSQFCENGIYKGICERSPSHTLGRIKHGSNVNIVCSKTGNSLLHVVMAEASPITETKYVPFVYQLSCANTDLNVENNDGLTPLRMSIKMHLLELMIALIKSGATCDTENDLDFIASCSGPVEFEFRAAYRKFAPGYWIPIEENKAFKVNVLVKSWCRINIQKNGKTLIEFAKEKEAHEKIVRMLIDNEVTLEFVHATIAGDAERMLTLKRHYPVDMDTKDYTHRENLLEPYCPLTLYGAALKYGHRHVLHLLKYSGDFTIKHMRATHTNTTSTNSHSSALCNIL